MNRRIAEQAALLVGGACCGIAATLVWQTLLYPPWFQLMWHSAVRDWLFQASGNHWLAFAGSHLCLELPEYALAVVLGWLSGLVLREQWWRAALPCAIGWQFGGELFLMLAGEGSIIALVGWESYFQLQLLQMIAPTCLMITAYCSARFRRSTSTEE